MHTEQVARILKSLPFQLNFNKFFQRQAKLIKSKRERKDVNGREIIESKKMLYLPFNSHQPTANWYWWKALVDMVKWSGHRSSAWSIYVQSNIEIRLKTRSQPIFCATNVGKIHLAPDGHFCFAFKINSKGNIFKLFVQFCGLLY